MSEPHETFEGEAADPVSSSGDAAAPENPDTDVDAGGADSGFSSAETEAGGSAPESAVDAEMDGAVATAHDADTEAEVLDAVIEPPVEDKAAQYLALAQRTQADFENYKKRAARDAALSSQRGIAKLVRDLLPALDNLDRAITHASSEDPLLEGIKLVRSDLQNALTRAGIESFDPAGETFDPNVHEAVAQFPKEGVDPGTVVEVYQQGYRLGETVLRPARVVVAA